MQDIKPLLVFAAVLEHGSMNAAAAALGMTPSAVSQHVGRLERQYGVKLLNRSTRRMAPTEAGRALAASCTRLLACADDAFAMLENVKRPIAYNRQRRRRFCGFCWKNSAGLRLFHADFKHSPKRLNNPDKGTLSAASQSKLLCGRLARPVCGQPPMAALCFAAATRCPVICIDSNYAVSSAAAGITYRTILIEMILILKLLLLLFS